jgi:hypothetical protein
LSTFSDGDRLHVDDHLVLPCRRGREILVPGNPADLGQDRCLHDASRLSNRVREIL